MITKSSTALTNDYEAISTLAHESEEPIYITKNGERDTVLMSLEAFEKREQVLKLQSKIMVAENSRLAGDPTISLEQAHRKLELKDLNEVESILKNNLNKNDIEKYLTIMDKVRQTNVSSDKNFQRLFNGFYRVRRSIIDFCPCYYDYMENKKGSKITFDEVVTYFYVESGRIEASFSSKLLATLNPNMPIWDSLVLKALGFRPPTYSTANRLQETINVYHKILEWYENYMKTDHSKEVINLFDKLFPYTKITDIKIIDFVLWAIGKNMN